MTHSEYPNETSARASPASATATSKKIAPSIDDDGSGGRPSGDAVKHTADKIHAQTSSPNDPSNGDVWINNS